jgi:hypothetical protein
MTHVHVDGEIAAAPDAVWALVGDFGGLVKALGAPAVKAVRGVYDGGIAGLQRHFAG